LKSHHQETCYVVNYYRAEDLAEKVAQRGLVVQEGRYYMNGIVSKAIYELHILLKWLDFYNSVSRRLFPLFYLFTFPGRGKSPGYGLAMRIEKPGN
jgi:hypothetical protein